MVDGTYLFWIGQVCGIAALVYCIMAFQSSDRKKLLKQQMYGTGFFTAHFFLLDAMTGALMSLIMTTRNWVFEKKDTSGWAGHIAWMPAFIFIALTALAYSWQGPISLLPAFGVICGTYGHWCSNPAHIRIFAFIAGASWIPYALAMHSYPGVITRVILATSVAIAIVRLDWKPFAAKHQLTPEIEQSILQLAPVFVEVINMKTEERSG